MNLFLILWYPVGLLSAILLFAIDLRGKSYDEDYFTDKILPTFLVITCGFFALVLVVFAYSDKYKFFQKLIYRISNIGISVKETNDEQSNSSN